MVVLEDAEKMLFIGGIHIHSMSISQIRGTRKWTIIVNFGKYQKQSISIGIFSCKEKAYSKMHELADIWINKELGDLQINVDEVDDKDYKEEEK